jgi:hypothetical protein
MSLFHGSIKVKAGFIIIHLCFLFPNKAVAGSSKSQGHKRIRPANDHPWRQSPDKKPMLSYEETDTEIISMLNDLFSSTRAWA